ncbi:MAG: hypothetical protein QM817_08085 [Archangium sp.]
MTRVVYLALGVLIAACTQSGGTASANLIGTHDLVLVDQLAEDGTLAKVETDASGSLVTNGLPSRYLFVTSADTNELRVFENFRPNTIGPDWMRGPNPLETLSIPVLDRPTMLATSEARNSIGQRASGQYVFAARPGGAEVSIVSLALRRQLGRPVATPAPVLAIGASLAVVDDKPSTSTLFVGTWDGQSSGVFAAEIDADPSVAEAAIRAGTFKFSRVTTIDGVSLSAMLVVAPLATRTVDGVPFCNAATCLALASRVAIDGTGGEAWLFEPSTGRSVKLAYGGPVRKFATGTTTTRLYALLDEGACGSGLCGGVTAVDLLAGTQVSGFPESKDVVGRPFGPLRVTEGLITGLTIAQGGVVQRIIETTDDAGVSSGLSTTAQEYDELGAFSSSDGLITWFSGVAGSIIDYNGQRSQVNSAILRAPGRLADGGYSLFTPDGGPLGALVTGTLDTPTVLAETFRKSTVSFTGELESTWKFDVSDGYFLTQEILIINQALVPGLVGLGVDGGTTLATGGYEVRASVNDTVIFETGVDPDFVECGRANVTAIAASMITFDAFPAGCADATRASIRASGAKPWVVVAGLDGYLGRADPGTQFTYSKPLILIPADVVADRTSLTIDLPMSNALLGEGAYLAFGLQSYITPLRSQIDTVNLPACSQTLSSQVVFGNLVMAQPPRSTDGQSVTFPWRAFAVVPSSNSMTELLLTSVRAGGSALNGLDNVRCWR